MRRQCNLRRLAVQLAIRDIQAGYVFW